MNMNKNKLIVEYAHNIMIHPLIYKRNKKRILDEIFTNLIFTISKHKDIDILTIIVMCKISIYHRVEIEGRILLFENIEDEKELDSIKKGMFNNGFKMFGDIYNDEYLEDK